MSNDIHPILKVVAVDQDGRLRSAITRGVLEVTYRPKIWTFPNRPEYRLLAFDYSTDIAVVQKFAMISCVWFTAWMHEMPGVQIWEAEGGSGTHPVTSVVNPKELDVSRCNQMWGIGVTGLISTADSSAPYGTVACPSIRLTKHIESFGNIRGGYARWLDSAWMARDALTRTVTGRW